MQKVLIVLAFLFIYTFAIAQAPTVEFFKKTFYNQMQKLLPGGYEKRSIAFVDVVAGKPTGGHYPFKVTAYVQDYDNGYPPNKYYGQTCLGKMEGWKFDLLKDEFGVWIVQGAFTITNNQCKANPTENSVSISLPGQAYVPGEVVAPAPKNGGTATESQLYVGEYACYGTGGRMMTGMGFILLSNGKYYDLDKKRDGSYSYNKQQATIQFTGGFLSGQKGTGVKQTGFKLSNTVNAEPYR